MENDLQADTETLMQICTDTLVRNLRLWRVEELVSRSSLKLLPGLNAGTFDAAISISLPVCGLRPLRAAR